MDRAYSILTVKAVEEDQRIIRGIATTPTPDRVGDIVEPLGVQFKNPMPLLWQHRSDKPIGLVTFGKPTKDGIPFEAQLADVKEAGTLKDRIDEAWQSVKARIVRAVSIGFRAIEYTFIEATGGIRFIKTEVFELSLVTIPANAEATITAIKSCDTRVRAALGIRDEGVARPVPPGASGSTATVNPSKGAGTMNVSARLTALEAQRKEKATRWEAIQAKAIDEGRTKTEEERTEFDTLRDEIKELDSEIADLRDVEKMAARSARPVSEEKRGREGGIAIPAQVKKEEKLDPGIAFTRLVKVKAVSRLEIMPVEQVARKMYGEDSSIYGAIVKANEVLPGTAASGNWGYDLISQEGAAVADFVEYLRSEMIVGKFGTNGIPALNGGIGFYEPYVIQTGGGAGYWVGEAKPKPLTSFDFDRSTLTPLKMANIAVLSEENIRRSSPKSDTIIRDQLVRALVELEDQTFTDPANSGSANVKPASITNGASTVAATGTGDADDIRLDIRALMKKYTDAHNPPRNGVLIMNSDNAIALGTMVNALGQPEFPGMGLNGGRLLGFPTIVSDYVSTNVIMVNASDIYYVDEGVNVDTSNQVSLEMKNSSGVTQDGSAGTGASLVSMWQNNMVAFRAEMTVNWKKRRASAVAYLTGAAWGGAVPAS